MRRWIGGAVALMVSASAGAATTPYVFYNSASYVFTGLSPAPGVVTVDKFDTSLGLLRSIEIGFFGNASGFIGIENQRRETFPPYYELPPEQTCDPSEQFSGTFRMNFDIRAGTGGLAYTLEDEPGFARLGCYDYSLDYTGQAGATLYGTVGNGGAFVLPYFSDLQAFAGPGTIDLPITFTNLSTVEAVYAATVFAAIADAMLVMRYTYDEVPEPAALGLLGCATMLLAVRRRASAGGQVKLRARG